MRRIGGLAEVECVHRRGRPPPLQLLRRNQRARIRHLAGADLDGYRFPVSIDWSIKAEPSSSFTSAGTTPPSSSRTASPGTSAGR